MSRTNSRSGVYERQAKERRASLLYSTSEDSLLSRKLSLPFEPLGGGREDGVGMDLGPRKLSLQRFQPLDTITDSDFTETMGLTDGEFSDLFLETLTEA